MAKEFFSSDQKKTIVKAIADAELNTSGEIQVHIEKHCKENVLDRAANVFAKLKMHDTKQKNGVLFYLALKDHQFAILGDSGINSAVPSNFWEDIKDRMQEQFKNGEFTEGLCEGIQKAGQQLKAHFPYHKDDKNELSNELSFGKE